MCYHSMMHKSKEQSSYRDIYYSIVAISTSTSTITSTRVDFTSFLVW